MSGANVQMGTLRLERNVFMGINPCCVSPQPIFGVVLNLRSGGRIGHLGICTPGFRGSTVLVGAGAGTRPTSESVLEKELKFSPTFGDYVKVLESIKIDRGNLPGSDSEHSNARNRSAGNDGSGKARSKEDKKIVEPRVASKSRGVHADRKLESYSDGEQFAHERRDRYSRDEQNGKLKRDETKRNRRYPVENAPEKARPWMGEDESSGKNRNLRNVNENNLGKKMSWPDSGKTGDNDKFFGGPGLPGNRFHGKMGDIKSLKSSLKKTSVLKDNSDSMLAESEFTRDSTVRSKFYEITRKRMDESGIHESQLRRNVSPCRIDKSQKRSIRGSFQCSVPDIGSVRVQQNTNLDNVEIDATDQCDHSRRWTALDNSTEINVEPRNQQHIRLCGDVLTKLPRSKVSKIDRKLGMIDLKADKDARGHVRDMDLNDRTAFKTFEVFTDIKNRPRVLRMELEERIQNLARRLHATDVNMPEWKFSKLIHDAKIKFTDHSILRMVQILGAFGNWRRVLQVVEWLQSRERFKSYKSRYIYTTVLSVLGKAKRPMEALNVFYVMRQELSSYPDLAAYHCIAVILGQAGLMKELFDIIDCMRAIPEKKFKLGVLQKWGPQLEPDLVVYNAVLNACVQQKQWEGAFWVLQELKKKGIRPSNTTYGLVMEVMLVCGKYNLVHEFFRQLEKSSIPGALNYKVLVDTFWREGKIDEAVFAVKDMERRGIVGSASLYYELARCLCSAGRCQEALLQIDKICKVAQKPLVVTYTGLIQTCLDSGSIQNAMYIFNEMHKFCSPNVVTCNVMLKSYVEHGMFQEAKCLFLKMLQGNKFVIQKADLKGNVIPDKFTFNTMMDACIDAKCWDDFEYAYQQMLHYGFHFDAKRHLRMVMKASRGGKVQLLDTTFEHLVCSGRTPPPALVKERICLRLQDGDWVAALSCLDISEPVKLQFYSEKAWLDTLNSNLNRFDKAALSRLVSEVENLPSQGHEKSPVLQNLLNACKKIINSSTTAIE
ncbi:hypothetical protein Taro_016476 [Colocasia esculenta]|uniref:Pentatricopeptide repeat-containing protein n=1 Tax=Colocasia esculenta TaxID=4460 RepID=A0A843UKE6_COLES|nr:hypothetical protein [Colocasia esculenta]